MATRHLTSALQVALSLCGALYLAGCGTVPTAAAAPEVAAGAGAAPLIRPVASAPVPTPLAAGEDAYSLTVTIASSAKRDEVESRYGGRVVVWQPDHGFAVLALPSSGADLSKGPAAGGGPAPTLEANKGAYSGSGDLAWISGGVGAWAGGGVGAWAGGGVGAWAGGTFSPVPQNTAKWQSLHLQQAQAVASHLGEGIKVAVIDTGIDLKHPAFQGSLAPAAEQWDYVDQDAIPQEQGVLGQGAYGHGTSVAGIVLQIAPRVQLLPLRVLRPDGSGDVLDVAAAITRAADDGASIINLSLGSTVRSEAVASAIEAVTARGVYVVSSSGNTADQGVTFPANDAALNATLAGQYSLSVGSVDALDHKSAFSTYGASLEIVAPGEEVYGPVPDQRLGAWTGTSMATPMVAGALALALGEHPKLGAGELTHRLVSRSVNIYQHDQNPAFHDLLGEGRLDVSQFLNAVLF